MAITATPRVPRLHQPGWGFAAGVFGAIVVLVALAVGAAYALSRDGGDTNAAAPSAATADAQGGAMIDELIEDVGRASFQTNVFAATTSAQTSLAATHGSAVDALLIGELSEDLSVPAYIAEHANIDAMLGAELTGAAESATSLGAVAVTSTVAAEGTYIVAHNEGIDAVLVGEMSEEVMPAYISEHERLIDATLGGAN